MSELTSTKFFTHEKPSRAPPPSTAAQKNEIFTHENLLFQDKRNFYPTKITRYTVLLKNIYILTRECLQGVLYLLYTVKPSKEVPLIPPGPSCELVKVALSTPHKYLHMRNHFSFFFAFLFPLQVCV